MKLRKTLLYAAVILCAVALARTSFASHNASVIRTSPAPDGGKYINVEESNTLKKWKFNFGILFDYCFEPLEFALAGGTRQRGIVDDLFIAHMNGAVAFTDWFSFGFNFPLVIAETFFDPFLPPDVDPPKQTNKGVFGDAKVEMKFRLLNIERYHFGISVVPFLYIPTGNTTYFLGTGMWSPGAMLVFDADIKNRLFLSLNAGYRNYSKTNYFNDPLNPNAIIDDTLILNLGANVRLSDSWAILGEATSENVISALWKNQTQNPAEFLLGMRYTSRDPKGLAITFGGGGGITHGVGSPDYRVIVGVNYRRPKKAAPLAEPEVVVEEKIAITQSIHFEFDRAAIRPVSYPILNDVTQVLQQNPQIQLVRVEGHTDWIGSDDYNFRLSEKRANAVRDYLTANGISYDRLTAVGYGESRPVADNNTSQGRARNRRTEFTVIDSADREAGRAAARTSAPRAPAETYASPPASSAPQTRSKYTTSQEHQKTVAPPPAAPAPARPPQPVEPVTPPQRYGEPPVSPDGQPPAPDISSLGDIRAFAQIKGIINFAANDSELNADAMANLKALANYVRSEKSVIGLRFQGFPGTASGEMGNSTLSWDRATKTQNYFLSQLQAGGRKLDISSYGFANQTMGVGRESGNGKVVIWVLRKLGK